MAERKCNKNVEPSVLQPKKQPVKSSKAQRSKKLEEKQPVKSTPAPRKEPIDDLLSKEEEYKLLNAELEAKTVDVLKEAERIMKEQTEILSEPLCSLLLEGEDEARTALQEPTVAAATKKGVTFASPDDQAGETSATPADKSAAAVQESVDGFLAETIRHMEEKMNDADGTVGDDDCLAAGDHDMSGVSDAQIRVLKAKLRIMQEEMDQLSCDYYKKDDDVAKLVAKIKELEDDRARLQRTVNVQQTQIEKYKAMGEESDRRSDLLQSQVTELQKQIEILNRSQKQAAGAHSSTEVRLTRAQEEVDKLKSQLKEQKQLNKDKIKEEQQSKENIVAENKMLKKQKAELIMGFKKQLKLIDILKRQKMHFEAAKLLSFTEEEFVKALDWGKT